MEIKECWLCGRNGSTDSLELHHIFGGSNRKHSEKYGLVVYLCGNECHRNGKYAVHRNKYTMEFLHKYGQGRAMRENNWSIDDFRKIFGRSYL